MVDLADISLPAVASWAQTLDMQWVEPSRPSEVAMMRPKATTTTPPRANVQLHRRVLAGQPPLADVAEQHLAQMAQVIAGLHVEDRGPLAFDDGVPGYALLVRHEVVPGAAAVQRVVFRIDGEVLTRLTGSVAVVDAARLKTVIDPTLKSFRPRST